MKNITLRQLKVFEAVATQNRGVRETLTEVARQVLRKLKEEMR